MGVDDDGTTSGAVAGDDEGAGSTNELSKCGKERGREGVSGSARWRWDATYRVGVSCPDTMGVARASLEKTTGARRRVVEGHTVRFESCSIRRNADVASKRSI